MNQYQLLTRIMIRPIPIGIPIMPIIVRITFKTNFAKLLHLFFILRLKGSFCQNIYSIQFLRRIFLNLNDFLIQNLECVLKYQ